MGAGGTRPGAPDLVLSDLEMPGLGGIELTRRLRAQARTALVPIILFSANNRLPALLEGLAIGADDFMLKPFRPPELLARLRYRYQLCEMTGVDHPPVSGWLEQSLLRCEVPSECVEAGAVA